MRSPRVEAMRAAAARAARRRGSRRMILPFVAQGWSSRASGTTVVLPAPGGRHKHGVRRGGERGL
jgi:hypothetical protein